VRSDADQHIIEREAQALESLNSAIANLLKQAMDYETLQAIVHQQCFSPAQDDEIAHWFARFITIRSNLWSVVDTAIANADGLFIFKRIYKNAKPQDWQYFVLAYSAVCSLVRIDHFLLNNVAIDSIIQRKLNEAFPSHRIQRKQYSKIYAQLLLPSNAILIHQAHRIINKYRAHVATAILGSPVEFIFNGLSQQERYLDLSKRRYFAAWLANRRHALLRRGASAKQKSIFKVLEYSGRFASEIRLPRPKQVTSSIRDELAELLCPGDILITRHNRALTNVFLPGFWPHAALYIGYKNQACHASIDSANDRLGYWQGGNCTFEALKDGVHFRALEETLNVDAFVVLRPVLSEQAIGQAIAKAITHAGKKYNFDFDFFRSDHLVCTEVIYRAYDGVDDIAIPLQEVMGRKALSAEDLLDFALDSGWAKPIAIYGVGQKAGELIVGAPVDRLLRDSYKS